MLSALLFPTGLDKSSFLQRNQRAAESKRYVAYAEILRGARLCVY